MTDIFRVSDRFDPYSKDAISKAIKLSKLPEGIQALSNLDVAESNEVQGPFVVFAADTNAKISAKAYKMGALGYIPLTYNITTLVQKLNDSL